MPGARSTCDPLRRLSLSGTSSKGAFLLESVLVALIGGAVTLAGVVASNSRSRAVMEQKIDELTRRVEKHNRLVKRTYLFERDVAVLRNDVESFEKKEASHD